MVWCGLQWRSWQHCWHDGSPPAVLRSVVFVIVFRSSGGIVQELVAAPNLADRLASCGDYGYDLLHWGRGLYWFRRPQGLHRGSHPIVGGNIQVSCRTVCGRWAIVPTVTAWAVSSFPYDMAGMASDRTEVTALPSVLMRSVRRTYPCQSGHAWRDLVPLPSFLEVVVERSWAAASVHD